jgi:hypothetical protein
MKLSDIDGQDEQDTEPPDSLCNQSPPPKIEAVLRELAWFLPKKYPRHDSNV